MTLNSVSTKPGPVHPDPFFPFLGFQGPQALKLFFAETPSPERCLVIILLHFVSFRQLGNLEGEFLLGEDTQEMGDAVETCPSFVIGTDDVPGSKVRVGVLQHLIPGFGVFVPASV